MFQVILRLYSLLYSAGLLIFAVWEGLGRLFGRPARPLSERFAPKGLPLPDQAAAGNVRIWVHAVSVGEVNAVRPLVRSLGSRPGVQLFVSTTTLTGQQIARAHFADLTVFYFPFDLDSVCRRWLKRIRPHVVLLAETEIWPNFLVAADREKVPVLLINGRLSDRSFARYRRFRPLFRHLLRRISHFCVQSRLDRQRFLEMGVPEDCVNWVGSLKFDYEVKVTPTHEAVNAMIERLLRRDEKDLVLVCGSTKPGEEELLLEVACSLRTRHPQLKLLIAPRHPKRGEEVLQLAQSRGLSACLRSGLTPSRPAGRSFDCLILDSIGELAQVYQIADLVFIGGSLVNLGGQNLIEPAAFGKPILFGPDMSNFREIAAAFLEAYAALQVDSPADLEARLEILITDAHARIWLGRNARKVIRDNQGAVSRTIEILETYLPGRA